MNIEINKIEPKRNSIFYSGCIKNKFFTIDICNDTICAMEYDFNSNEDFTDDEIEEIANSILDDRFILVI